MISDTLRVGQIKRIVKPGTIGHFQLEIILFYRPEDTGRPTSSFSHELYYNEEERTVSIAEVKGRCYVKFLDMGASSEEMER